MTTIEFNVGQERAIAQLLRTLGELANACHQMEAHLSMRTQGVGEITTALKDIDATLQAIYDNKAQPNLDCTINECDRNTKRDPDANKGGEVE